MPRVYKLEGITPVIDPTAYVHETAVLIGDVIVGAGCYVGPGASLRGDFGRIVMEKGSNLQDNCVVHGFPQTDTVIEEDGHIGHGAVLHCCRIGRNAMIGMNSVINDNAVVGESAIVAAMAFVRAGFQVPPKSLAAGIPAQVKRKLSDEELAWKRHATAEYQELARRCLASLTEATALTAVEPDRGRVAESTLKPLHETKGGSR